jgi:hypothetical protein
MADAAPARADVSRPCADGRCPVALICEPHAKGLASQHGHSPVPAKEKA